MSVSHSHSGHFKHDTVAFGTQQLGTYESIQSSVPTQPEKTYLVIIKGPKPGIYF
ncbi:hypothetical protein BDR05DRAFT_969753, partial [Suillus weaverae]